MRLFTAIDLPPDVVARLDALITRLRPLTRLRWSPAANLHVTTKFIGDWPEGRLTELQGALAAVCGRTPFPVSMRGLGWFPSARNPRVFSVGVDGGEALSQLARDTDRALEAIGVARETKAYSPHVTLARGNVTFPLDGLEDDFGAFPVNRFWLYQSKLQPQGSVYTKLSALDFYS